MDVVGFRKFFHSRGDLALEIVHDHQHWDVIMNEVLTNLDHDPLA